MILMIDNYDSFTYNIVQYCLELGADLKIIISPGPATPNDAGVCLDVIKYFAGKKPIFGICLGHQAIGQVFGGKVVKDTKIFEGLPQEFIQTRYHSLIVDKNDLPEDIIVTSYSTDDDEIMSLEIKDKQIYGVQFHPESIMSEHGYKIIGNFLKL